MTVQYNIIDNNIQIPQTKLKEIINKKLYRILILLEQSNNIEKNL